MQPDLVNKERIVRIPGLLNIDGFYHYFVTSPHLFPPPPVGGGEEGGRKRVIRVRQAHGDNILVINQNIRDWDLFMNSNIFDNGHDAIITDQAGIVLEIRTADCLPILIIDPHKKVVAAVHAGWKGSLMNLSEKVIAKMKKLFRSSAETLFIGFGPSIGQCCYEVGSDIIVPVRDRYPDWTDIIDDSGEGKGMFNLEGFNRRQLLSLGIREERIFSVNLCTSCNPDQFPSYRRDGRVDKNIFAGIMIGQPKSKASDL